MTIKIYKRWQIFLTFVSLLVLGSSFYFQYREGMQPCPLCLMQRFCVLILFMLCFIGVIVRRLRAVQIISFLQFFFAAWGLFFAGRQLWLQSLPAGQTPACMPGLDVLLRYFPWQDVVHALLWGSGDCAESRWQLLGLSMPAWAALYFFSLLIAAGSFFKLARKAQNFARHHE